MRLISGSRSTSPLGTVTLGQSEDIVPISGQRDTLTEVASGHTQIPTNERSTSAFYSLERFTARLLEDVLKVKHGFYTKAAVGSEVRGQRCYQAAIQTHHRPYGTHFWFLSVNIQTTF